MLEDSNPLLLMVLAYVARDIVPWFGNRLVEACCWFGPRFDKVLNSLLAEKSVKPADKPAEKPDSGVQP